MEGVYILLIFVIVLFFPKIILGILAVIAAFFLGTGM